MHSTLVIAGIGIGWIAFWLYWIVSASKVKKGTLPNIKQFAGTRIILLGLAYILVLIYNHLPLSFKQHYLTPTNSTDVLMLGFVIFLLGIFLAVWARINLGKNWGMPMTQKQTPELVTSGPYHYIRHPIYSGILLMAFGSFLDVNVFWLLIFIVAGVYFIYSAISEEQLMIKQFPKVYPSYKRRTKMLIPFIF